MPMISKPSQTKPSPGQTKPSHGQAQLGPAPIKPAPAPKTAPATQPAGPGKGTGVEPGNSGLLGQVQQTRGYQAQQGLMKPDGAPKGQLAPKGQNPAKDQVATKADPSTKPSTEVTPGAPGVNLGIPGGAGLAQGGLPDTLQELPSGKRVAHGTDPGDFYCEHMFFSIQNAAAQHGSSVVQNEQGESLTGFLHMPGDREATDNASETYLRKDSRKDAQAVVGSALRGWIDTALPKAGTGPVKMLLTGYANWGSVVNNPTGGFVSSKKNLDAAMVQGFGQNLLTKSGKVIEESGPDPSGGGEVFHTWSYRVNTESGEREVQLRGQVFPVSDAAIDKGPKSVQQVIAEFAPHGVLSMGVAVGHDDFLAEHHADDGGLDDSHKRHDDAMGPRVNLPDNYALARGIVQGQAAGKV